MSGEFGVGIVALFAGAMIALFSSLTQAWIGRRTASSNLLLEHRVEKLNEIWLAFLTVRTRFASIALLGLGGWLKKYKADATTELNVFRLKIDQSQVILPRSIVDEFRKIDSFLFDVMLRDQMRFSEYDKELKKLLKSLSRVVQESLSKGTHEIDLELRT